MALLLFILFSSVLFAGCNRMGHIDIQGNIGNYQIGAGIWDITGPIARVGFMGYAQASQVGTGLNFRLRARAFIFVDPTTQKRVVFVSTDSCMIFTGVKAAVVQQLNALYNGTYNDDNVLLSGTHTHSGPAGYSYYLIYNIMSYGFHQQNFDTIVSGIVNAISMAHDNLSEGGSVYFNVGELLDSNINRSPSAYLMNPASERAKYEYDVDKNMTLLRLEDQNGKELGSINWFSVHGTSMMNNNTLVSGDNKGHAGYLFEKFKNGNSSLPGFGPFVSAFAQTNEGDVSPNTKGAFCNNGLPCDFAHSTCGGTSEGCHGYGPGKDDFESMAIIGDNQFKKALELYEGATQSLNGPVDYIHTYLNMGNITVSAQFSGTGQTAYTCHGSLGDGFAAGTTDGPGDFDFTQGANSTSDNPYWNFLGQFITDPSDEEIACQAPKPILLNTGDMSLPSPWSPEILPIQILRVGQLFILGVPGEFTTMSGRRLRDTVRSTLVSNGIEDPIVVIAGLSNAYSHYIATYEEYQFQRYEGASTLYGPNTLAAYQQEFTAIATALVNGESYPAGTSPPDLSNDGWSIEMPFIPDWSFYAFGTVDSDVQSSYVKGDTVIVSFWGADPTRDYRTQDTYLTVEFLGSNGDWTVVLTDGDSETRFTWERYEVTESIITIQWNIPMSAQSGTYRIQTFGSSQFFDTLEPYTGTSSSFTVSE